MSYPPDRQGQADYTNSSEIQPRHVLKAQQRLQPTGDNNDDIQAWSAYNSNNDNRNEPFDTPHQLSTSPSTSSALSYSHSNSSQPLQPHPVHSNRPHHHHLQQYLQDDDHDQEYQDMGSSRTPLPSPPPPTLPLPSSYHSSHQNTTHIAQPTPLPKLPPFLPPPGSVPGSGSGFVHGIEAAAASAMTLANNIGFKPTAAQPAKCSKLKIRIFFDSTIFQAGGNLFGRMEITASSSRSLKLGEISVELAAYEEITSRELTATQSFLSSRLSFQGSDIPPSNAVTGPCDEYGFWTARKGKTTFPFAFQLPLDCPSSLVFGQTASLRYVVTGLVQVFYHGRDETILKTKEAFVVEAWDGYNPEYKLPVRGSNSTKLFWGGGGSLILDAMLSERLHTTGGNLTVEVKVTNNTSRKVQGIRLGVARRLEMVSDKEKAARNPGLTIDTTSISETIGTQEFKTSSYLFDTGEERTMTINMIVPSNARTIRGTALFEVTCFVVVSMLLGAFSGELSVEIPVQICHPASLTPAPRPKLEQNHLPHLYNLADEDISNETDVHTQSDRRIGSTTSLTIVGDENNDGIGRQGEWNEDEPQLSPANSITSIKSLLASPKHKLSKLADKIQRSTSPTSSGHLNHEHGRGSKHTERPESPRRHIVKSPPLGPALPIAYVPAVERVRYTPFAPPPTTKAKEFLKAAAQYQQEMAIGGGAFARMGDNQEFDFNDKTMATAIHQWISRKESESIRPASPPNAIQAPKATRPLPSPVPITSVSPNRRRPAIDPIDTRSIGSYNSQQGPSSPQSYYSPIDSGRTPHSPTDESATHSTARFLKHAHRQPAAPQTSAFGSAPEECSTTPPLFARPLPLPSPPPTGSPHQPRGRDGISANHQHPRPVSPISIPVQSPESLALAREAYERVKRAASPVPNPLASALTPTYSAPKTSSGFLAQKPQNPHQPQAPLDVDLTIKVPVPIRRSPIQGTVPSSSSSELSRLFLNESGSETMIHHAKHARDGHSVETVPPEPCSSPELRHVPMNRPLPVPGPKPRHLNQPGPSINTNYPSSGHIDHPPSRVRPEPAKRPPVQSPTSHVNNISPVNTARPLQQNTFVPKTASASPSVVSTPTVHKHQPPPSKPIVPPRATSGIASSPQKQQPKQESGQGFAYPRATRKPVPAAKPPSVATKPRVLTVQGTAGHGEQRARKEIEADVEEDQEIQMLQTASMRAPQLITNKHKHQITRGFKDHSERTVGTRKDTAIVEEAETEEELTRHIMGRGHLDDGQDPELARRLAIPVLPSESQVSNSSRHLSKHQEPHQHQDRLTVSNRKEQTKESDSRNKAWATQTPHHRHYDTPHYDNPKVRKDQDQHRRGVIQQVTATSRTVVSPSSTTALFSEGPVMTREQRQRQTLQQQRQHQLSEQNLNSNTGTAQAASQHHDDFKAATTSTEPQEGTDQTQSEIRAQAIAAANSFRATGSNSGGYVVNTGKLRQVMHDANGHHINNNNSAGGSGSSNSGHLIQVLAGGARNAASAVVSGLGWKANGSPSSAPLQQQLPQGSRDLNRRVGGQSALNGAVPEQSHDLTMKDINFQTATPLHSSHHHSELPRASDAVLPSAPMRDDICAHNHVHPKTTTTAAHPSTTTTATTHASALVSAVTPVPLSAPSASSSSLASSVSQAQTTTAVAVAVSTSSAHVIASETSILPDLSGLNLDKTLPKIQEDKQQPTSSSSSRSKIIERPDPPPPPPMTSSSSATLGSSGDQFTSTEQRQQQQPVRSQFFERPEKPELVYVANTNVNVSAGAGAAVVKNQQQQQQQQQQSRYAPIPTPRSRYGGVTADLGLTPPSNQNHGLKAGGGGGGGTKGINPKLQAYIQKYNMAANTRG
ncbi:hypothetical protein BG004_008123 [Podila humilis]|nr:hypothetical protein BG004_008123 [Podila humilis]